MAAEPSVGVEPHPHRSSHPRTHFRLEHLFVCGIALNQRDMLDLFDLIFLLSLDHDTQIERLNAASNAHRTGAALAQILDGRPVFERQMCAVGAIALDGRQPIPILASRILEDVASWSRPAGAHARASAEPRHVRQPDTGI